MRRQIAVYRVRKLAWENLTEFRDLYALRRALIYHWQRGTNFSCAENQLSRAQFSPQKTFKKIRGDCTDRDVSHQ
jgi:hypothetical protein